MGLSHSEKESIRKQFDSLSKKVLREKSRDIERSRQSVIENEVTFSELSNREKVQLYTKDKYSPEETWFCIWGQHVEIQNELLAEAVSSLSEEMRDILLLSYFLEMNDREIAELMNMIQRTVQRRRTSGIEIIRERMVTELYEEDKE